MIYASQRTNYEYTNPMVLNMNHKNINHYKNERIIENAPIITHNRQPLQMGYNGYIQKNVKVNPFTIQNNFNNDNKSKNYINYYRNVENFDKVPIKYGFSKFVAEHKNTGKQMTTFFDGINQKEMKNSINYKVNKNSIREPINFSPNSKTPFKSYYKNNPENFNHNKGNDLIDDKVHSLKKERNQNYVNIDETVYRNKNESNIKEPRYQHVILDKKSDNMEYMGENTNSFRKLKNNDDFLYMKNFQEQNKSIERSKNFMNDQKEKTEERRRNKLMEPKSNKEKDTNKEKYHEQEKDKMKGIDQKGNDASISLDNSNNKKNKKIQFKNKTFVYMNNKGTLPCVISLELNEDSKDLNKGLKTFEDMIVIDKSSVLKRWTGFEWEKLESNYNFFIKARYDKKGNIWCINNSYEVLKLMKNKVKNFGNLSNEEIIDIGFDKKNILWCINRKGELLKWNRTKWNKIKYSGFHKLICLSFDNKGDLWAINSKRALAVWNPKDKCWNEKIIKDNLKMLCIDFDTNGKLWVISTAGALLSYSCGNWMNFGYICLEELISIGFKKATINYVSNNNNVKMEA